MGRRPALLAALAAVLPAALALAASPEVVVCEDAGGALLLSNELPPHACAPVEGLPGDWLIAAARARFSEWEAPAPGGPGFGPGLVGAHPIVATRPAAAAAPAPTAAAAPTASPTASPGQAPAPPAAAVQAASPAASPAGAATTSSVPAPAAAPLALLPAASSAAAVDAAPASASQRRADFLQMLQQRNRLPSPGSGLGPPDASTPGVGR